MMLLICICGRGKLWNKATKHYWFLVVGTIQEGVQHLESAVLSAVLKGQEDIAQRLGVLELQQKLGTFQIKEKLRYTASKASSGSRVSNAPFRAALISAYQPGHPPGGLVCMVTGVSLPEMDVKVSLLR